MSDDIWNGRPPLGPPEATNPTADAAKVLPCPWCGGAASVEQIDGKVDPIRYSVGCDANEPLCMGYQSLTTFATAREAIAAWNTRPQPAPPEGEPLSEAQIKHMVDRFLGWRLPENFYPDCGISFKRTFNDHLPTPTKHEPTGTNLFDAEQTEVMVRYLIDGMPGLAARPKIEDAKVQEPDFAYFARLAAQDFNEEFSARDLALGYQCVYRLCLTRVQGGKR